jgi:hypothetical protein
MTTRLEKLSIVDARCDTSQEFRRWISQFGPKEVNLVQTPSASSQNNTASSFNVQLADNSTVVIDRSFCDITMPVTITIKYTIRNTKDSGIGL